MVLPPGSRKERVSSVAKVNRKMSLLAKDKNSTTRVWEKSIDGKNTIREVYTPEGSSPGPLVLQWPTFGFTTCQCSVVLRLVIDCQ